MDIETATSYKTLSVLDLSKMLLFNRRHHLESLMDMAQQGDVLQIKHPKPYFFINDPDIIYQVLVSNEANYTKEGTSFMRTRNVLNVGQLNNYGQEWARGRKATQGNFYHKNLPPVFPIINELIDKMLDQWDQNQHQPINLVESLCSLLLEIATATLFGRKAPFNSLKAVKHFRFANDYITRSGPLWVLKPTLGNIRYQRARHLVNSAIKDLLTGSHEDYPGFEPLLSPTFLDGHETHAQREWAIGQASNFLLASHDTTASLIGWVYYSLNHAQHFQDDLISEARTVLQGAPPTFDNYQSLHFTRQVVQETLRLYPPVWVIERRAIDPDQFGPLQVPEEANILISPFTIQRHPRYWDNPDQFNPYRFASNRSKDHPKAAFIPFGIGPRVCSGQHLAMLTAISIIAKISQRFYLRVTNHAHIQMEPLLTLKSTPDIMVHAQKV